MKIRPEINDVRYWLHLIVIAAIVVVGRIWVTGGTVSLDGDLIRIIGELAILIGIADITAHTLLQIN